MALAWIVIALSSAGCQARKEAPVSQAAARVNSGEISVHQINFVLQRQPGLKAEQLNAASRDLLERLIDQEVTVQKALEAKLDRNPKVVQALEATRRDILALAYAERIGEAAAQPSPHEVDKFYEDQPALFRHRRFYSYQEINVDVLGEQLPALEAKLRDIAPGQAVVDHIRTAGLHYSMAPITRPAEALPLELLNQFASLAVGQQLVSRNAAGLTIVILRATTPAPMTLQEARPLIAQFLHNDRKRQRIHAEVEALRKSATITYVGQFAQPLHVEAARAVPAASGRAPSAAPVAAPLARRRDDLDSNAIARGIEGLK